MYVIGFEAEIGGKKFSRLHEVQIEDSIKKLGKSARLRLPATARLERAGELVSEVEVAKVFTVGDPVVIRLGYDGDLVEEFRGYVKRISPTVPLEIECEDEVYQLRRKQLQKAFKSTTLSQLINFILADTDIEVVNEMPEINFRKFTFKNVNAAQALEKLRKDYGLTIYFRDFGQLVVGLASETDGMMVKYTIGQNVIKHSLEWEDEENLSLKVKAVAISKDNEFTTKVVGDPNGEQRTIYFYNLAAGEDLEQRAEQEILKYKYSGYRGSLEGFLLPVCRIGNTVRLRDETFDNKEGDYLVESVKTTLSDRGGRRQVKIGLKLD